MRSAIRHVALLCCGRSELLFNHDPIESFRVQLVASRGELIDLENVGEDIEIARGAQACRAVCRHCLGSQVEQLLDGAPVPILEKALVVERWDVPRRIPLEFRLMTAPARIFVLHLAARRLLLCIHAVPNRASSDCLLRLCKGLRRVPDRLLLEPSEYSDPHEDEPRNVQLPRTMVLSHP